MGGLFRQYDKEDNVSATGISRMAAVELAIRRLNNKTDTFFDELLPDAEVC